MKNTQFNVIDLFCGCGGFGLGAHLAGFNPILAVDIDETLSSSYAINFPNTKLRRYDLNEVSTDQLIEDCNGKYISGIIGGPPCQGFSTMGRRVSNDPRNLLLDSYFDHIVRIQPDFFIMENVPGLLAKDSLSSLEKNLDKVSTQYSIIGPVILDASDYGVPSIRKRVVVIGFNPKLFANFSVADLNKRSRVKKTTVKNAIHDLPPPIPQDAGCYGWQRLDGRKSKSSYSQNAGELPPQGIGDPEAIRRLKQNYVSGFMNTIHAEHVSKRYESIKPGSVDRVSKSKRLEWDGFSPTLRAGTGREKGSHQAVRPLHPESGRVITVREAARLQGFPDWYLFHTTKWHSFRMIGNSVSPLFAKELLSLIKEKYKISMKPDNAVLDSIMS